MTHAPNPAPGAYIKGMSDCYFKPYEPKDDLCDSVVSCIHSKEKHDLYIRILAASAVFLALIAATVPAISWLLSDILHSSFSDSFSLIFTDGAYVMTYWHEFGLLLLESAPIVSLGACLAIIVGFIISLKYLIFYTSSYRHLAS